LVLEGGSWAWGSQPYPVKKIVEKPLRNSAIFNGRRLWRRTRPKLGCGAKERESNSMKHNLS
jgi:hypothetical protein